MSETLDAIRLERLKHLRDLQRQSAKIKHVVARYYDDPIAFTRDCIDWNGPGLASYQEDVIDTLSRRKRVAVRGPHGLGKALSPR
jgi:hypothetical protein